MKGTCQKCGCTEDRACDFGDGRPCSWIDPREDLCSRCARELFLGPIDNLSDALLVVRSLRCALMEASSQVAELRELLMHVATNQGMIEAGAEVLTPSREIWTPGDL